jgi:large subunit ribosomal protein L33
LAKKKGGLREYMTLECTACGARGYRTPRRTKDSPKLNLSKYCRVCRKHTAHKERRK